MTLSYHVTASGCPSVVVVEERQPSPAEPHLTLSPDQEQEQEAWHLVKHLVPIQEGHWTGASEKRRPRSLSEPPPPHPLSGAGFHHAQVGVHKHSATPQCRKQRSAHRGHFWDGSPADIQGSGISRMKNFCQALDKIMLVWASMIRRRRRP